MKKNKVIFLCTGNICRSPMGEALLKHAIAALPKDDRLHELEVVSAGTTTVDGMVPSANSVSVLEQVGIDISSHLSSELTEDMLKDCFALFAMAQSHVDFVKRFYKNVPERMFTVQEMNPKAKHKDVFDPYGCSISEYVEVRDEIMSAIPHIVKYLENEIKKLSIGSDHGGLILKQELVRRLRDAGFEVEDKGLQNFDSVDYPDYALAVCKDVVQKKSDFGVLVCTTGIGMSMSANKFHGIRAAVCHMEDAAEFTRRHNDANVICFGEKYDTPYMAEKMVKIFADTEFEGGRHQRRIDKFMNFENCQS